MLVTLDEMKTYLGEATTGYDDFLTSQIELISATVDSYCGRKINQGTYTQKFFASDLLDPKYSRKLTLFHFPLISLTTVKEIETTNGVDSEELLTTSDYRESIMGTIKRMDSGHERSWQFSTADSRIEIEYSAGYASVPVELKHVCYNLVEEEYNKKKEMKAFYEMFDAVFKSLGKDFSKKPLSFFDQGVKVEVRGEWIFDKIAEKGNSVRHFCISLIDHPSERTPESILRYLDQNNIYNAYL